MKRAEIGGLYVCRDNQFCGLVPLHRARIPAKFICCRRVWGQIVVGPYDGIADLRFEAIGNEPEAGDPHLMG